MADLIGICQNPDGEQFWFPIDEPNPRCVVMGCECKPKIYVRTEITDEMVERAARALVAEQYQGCVSWEDTTDGATSGDEATRAYALRHARKVLEAALTLPPLEHRG